MNKRGFAIAIAGVGAGLAVWEVLRRIKEPSVEGQVVLITGGSRGLGLAMARQFARERCRIAICARDQEELDRARKDLARRAEVLAIQCDVSDRAQVERMIDRVLSHFGRLDILVNNAGIIQVGPVESMTVEDFESAMNTMFWGTVYPTLALLPHLLQRGSGRIVNIASIGGKVSVPHLIPYNCAKFAAVGFSEGLRAEMAGRGIKVVTIAPGLMRTGSYLNAFFKGDSEKEAAWFAAGASLPLLTISGRRAARQIVHAVKRGEPEKVLTAPANALARIHGLFPGATAEILGAVGRLILPEASDRKRRKRGSEARSVRTPLMTGLTLLGRIAARKLLQPQAVR